MADTSFYGGKPGFSFIIVMNYTSVEEMVSNFQLGPNYTAVHYDEHVLINTENKNDPDNGKIYRRGYSYDDDMGGAIYVGTIVGPAGPAPMLELTTIAEVKAIQETEGYDYRYSEGSYAPTENLIAGKDSDGSYNDEIQWACCCVRDENGEDATAYIGFIVPYLVVDFSAESVNPYFNRTSSTANFSNIDLANRLDDGSHPFYEKWHFQVPRGIKGDAIKNFRVVTASNSIEEYTGQSDDVSNKREVLVYDYYNYDKDATGEPVTIYLGDYNMITNIVLDDSGTITFSYSHDDDTVYSNLFKWIKEITLDTETGHFTVVYNYDTDDEGNPTKYETDLAWVNNISLSDDGKITLYYTGGKESTTLTNAIKWIDNITLDSYGTVIVNYNDGSYVDFEEKIKWITSVALEGDGTFTISFNNGDPDYQTTLTWVRDVQFNTDGTITIVYNTGATTIYTNLIQWVTGVSLSTTGEFRVKYNNGVSDYVTTLSWVSSMVIDSQGTVTITYNTGEQTTYKKFIKTISNVTIETTDSSGEEGTGDQKVHISYNTGDSDIIGEPLNYIMDTALETDTYHLLVRYSDPAKRQTIVDNGENFEYNGINDWYDLGSVKDYSGILVGLNISGEEGSNVSYIVNLLNSMYPSGLQGDLQGKIVTIGGDLDNKYFYAYDYANNSWYYLGNFDVDSSSLMMIAGEDDFDLSSKQNALNVGGFWFVLEDD